MTGNTFKEERRDLTATHLSIGDCEKEWSVGSDCQQVARFNRLQMQTAMSLGRQISDIQFKASS